MRPLPVLLTALLLVGGVAACSGAGELDAPPEVVTSDPVDLPAPPLGDDDGPDPASIISDVGVVRYVDLEGGFYGIETEDARYNPIELEADYKIDGLDVRFRARVRDDVMTIQQWGTPVEILEIMPVEGLMDGDN